MHQAVHLQRLVCRVFWWRQFQIVEGLQFVRRITQNAVQRLVEIDEAALHIVKPDPQGRQRVQAAQPLIHVAGLLLAFQLRTLCKHEPMPNPYQDQQE
ncbi:MAG: hypothetical protein NT123_19025 [Proteobacteria bacterium]|nr:hypothetical protein [Pseudomonadota bacterium]